MLLWLLWLIPASLITIICYATNMVACIFANEEGELPSFLSYWQTWDDSTDAEYYMHNAVPRCIDYDYSAHYVCEEGTTPKLAVVNRTRLFSRAIPGAKWTRKQRLQRYACRVLWLMRNCAYGFCFWAFGQNVRGSDMVWLKNNAETKIGYDGSRSKWLAPFIIKSDARINKYFRWKVFLGWKIAADSSNVPTRAMFAYRLLIDFDKEKEA